jgi:hypothetical protein
MAKSKQERQDAAIHREIEDMFKGLQEKGADEEIEMWNNWLKERKNK